MKCKYCGSLDSKVIDSRLTEDGSAIRRRRECINCSRRYTTYETVERTPIYVIKKGGIRQEFDINKIRNGIIKACEKRPVPITKIDNLISDIEKRVYNMGEQEINSEKIGDLVINGLREIDDVAYVRFASVYRQFKDIDTFLSEIESLLSKRNND
ncbi:MAG: transcriptional repressor NrdR [Clostridia bacterium]|nr:transcriptional repressor NrdR [Clostridia bacterium]